MKAKRLIAILICVVLCFSFSACKESSSSQPVLYKVTDSEGDVVWLMGSIHIGRDSFYPLPDYVTDAFNGADALAVELDIVAFEKDLNAQVQALQVLMMTDGTRITDHISEDTYQKAKKILTENEQYNTALDMFAPSIWETLITQCMILKTDYKTELGIDLHFLEQAEKQGKEILEIESAKEQYQMMADFSMPLQVYLLESVLEEYESKEALEELMLMVDAWQSGDIETLAKLNDPGEDLTDKEKVLYEEYHKAMITDRNLLMTDYAEDALQGDKEIFICVGAGHVLGDGGMADLLEQRGYQVEQVK